MKRAVFRDQHGQTYSAPMVLQDGQWLMRTSEGLAPVNLQFHDDQGGRLEFVEYRDEPDARLNVEGQGFRALQEAVAKERLRNEAKLASARREALTAANQTADARKIQQARDINNALAQRWHTYREVIPPPILTNERIGTMAEAARYRNRKIEPE